MTPDEVLARLRYPQPLPKAALQACAEQADVIVPRIADLMERAADPKRGVDRQDESIIFFGVFVVGEVGDRRAFRPLLKLLAGDPDTVDWLLGDALTETLAMVLGRIADHPEPLLDLVHNPDANEYARGAALQAWARYAVETPLSAAEVRDRMAAIHGRLQPDSEPYLAPEWCRVSACLGLDAFRPHAEQLLAAESGGLFGLYNLRAFDRDLARQAAAGSRYLMDLMGWTPFEGTAVDELSRWHAFRPDADRRRAGPSAAGSRNPYRDVGRNDPCPCGSGKKFKKCCGRT